MNALRSSEAVRRFRNKPSREKELGIALLISIFVLLLVCVAGIAMLVASGTESSLAGNYQSASAVYYAALAGLEEGRGRLFVLNPNYINNAVPGFLPSGGAPVPLGQVLYILNPSPGEAVNPTGGGPYQDTEYVSEFPAGFGGATVYTTASVSNANAAGMPGPLYKWVRINAISEQSINLDVDGGGKDTTTLYYDGGHLNRTFTGAQAFEVTSLAAFPNGSQKILQYVVAAAPLGVNLQLPAALTMDGNNVQMTLPYGAGFYMNGNDQYSVGSCNPDPTKPVTAIGFTNNGDSSQSNITAAIPSANHGNYEGLGGDMNVYWVGTGQTGRPTLDPSLQTVSGLNNLVDALKKNADSQISGPATESSLPPGMSPSSPKVVVVDGDLTITNGSNLQGYGILLVTGTLTIEDTPDAQWNGIVLVIGKGILQAEGGSSTGVIRGAVLIARTVDASGNPLPNGSPLGTPTYNFGLAGNQGIHYSSCWINAAQPRISFNILSFREIPQP